MNEHLVPSFVTCSDPESLYRGRSFVALDLETDEEQKGSALIENNDIVLSCWYVVDEYGNKTKKHVWGGIYDVGELLDDIASTDFLLAFNAKFELQWLKRAGAELRNILVYDPMLAQWALDGNQKGKGFERSLRGMAIRYGGRPKLDLVGKLFAMHVPTRDINRRWLLEYCWRDVDSMLDVFYAQMDELSRRNIWHLAHTRFLTCPVLADIEFEGLQLDPDKVKAEYIRVEKLLKDLGNQLADMTGGINLGSPKQLAEYLYDQLRFEEVLDHRGKPIRTPGGARSTGSKVLAQLEATTEEQKKFLQLYKDYNKASSLLEKNLDYFYQTCEHKDGKFHGLFRQNAVRTGRLASSGLPIIFPKRKTPKSVQLQNIPREYKELFWSGDPDYLVLSFDSSQVEFRVAVDMGQDTVGYEEIINGTDIHSFTAAEMTKAGEPTTRQEAKAVTFRPLYGGGSGSDALKAYCEYFKNKYVGISNMQRTWALQCVDKGQYETPYGMTFYFPGTKMHSRTGYIDNTTNIYNFPIQGFATGEIIPIALVYFWHKTRDLRVRIMAVIHDSIDTKTHKDDVEEATEIAKECLTKDVYAHLENVYNYKMKVPLGLGATVGKYWGDKTATEEKWDCIPETGEYITR